MTIFQQLSFFLQRENNVMYKEKVGISEKSKDSESVRTFYNEFTESRFLKYIGEKNPRIEKAIARIVPVVTSDSRVLEVGCGVGVVTEQIVRRAKNGSVWACDISERAIQYARQRITAPNVHFRSGDILHGFDELKSWISESVQLVVMVDVIEHLPVEEHPTLFCNLRSIMTKDSTLILTFPSPQYQHYLQEKDPHELQIIDEVVELSHILQVASETGFDIKHFSLEDVWLKNQYVHCVLEVCTDVSHYDIRQAGNHKSWRNFVPAPVRVIGRYGKRLLRRMRSVSAWETGYEY